MRSFWFEDGPRSEAAGPDCLLPEPRRAGARADPGRLRQGRLQRQAALGIVALLCLATGACSDSGPKASSTPLAGPQPATLAFPERGAYTGAYVDFGDTEDGVTLEAIEGFEKLAGKHQAVIASSSHWGKQDFPAKNVELISRHGAVPLIFWLPWDEPYSQNRPPDRFRLENILSGMWDGYIAQWADGARAFGKPLLVAWGIEMNGTWFPWSGFHYGGGKPTGTGSERGYAGPELYKKAFRYVVDRVRARGASNVLWGFHANHYGVPEEIWNTISQYYPGPKYADWLGLSVYGKQFGDPGPWLSFHHVMEYAYQEICKLDLRKPVIAAEWGVGEFPRSGDKAAWLREAFEAFKTRYTRIKAAVYWHERWQNEDESYSNLRVNSSPGALAAYREGVADAYWLGRPLPAK